MSSGLPFGSMFEVVDIMVDGQWARYVQHKDGTRTVLFVASDPRHNDSGPPKRAAS